MLLTDYFIYQHDGALLWKPRPASMFQVHASCEYWNRKNAGTVAGTRRLNRGKPAMICIQLHGAKLLAHRIVWELQHGPIPEGMKVDHRNMDPWDNRIENLRLATNSENMRNRGMQRNNTSGYKGVSFDIHSGRWIAQICVNGVSRRIGRYSTAKEAHEAYAAAAAEVHGEFVRTA